MQLLWLGVVIASTVGYHVVLKLTPTGASPYLSFALTYAIMTLVFASIYAVVPGTGPLPAELSKLNWTTLALAGVVVLLDLGFLMMYRGGFPVSLGQLTTQSAAALLLLLIGMAVFGERLSLTNVAGIGLCVAGLWLINRP
jgi:drug/metabolite transporter (DMT)-like permease